MKHIWKIIIAIGLLLGLGYRLFGQVTVKDVTRMTLPAAISSLRHEGMDNIELVNFDPSWVKNRYQVVEQSIEPGTRVDRHTKIELTCAKVCDVYLDLKSKWNWIFNKYDVDVQFDGEWVGSIANGEYYGKLIEGVLEGKHDLVMSKAGSTSIAARETLDINGDYTFTCKIGHSWQSISLFDCSRVDNVDAAHLTVQDVTGMVLSQAETRLASLGFQNKSPVA